MPLVKNVKAILRWGQNSTAAQPEVREHEIVVSDNDVGLLKSLPGAKEATPRDMRAPPTKALTVICCDRASQTDIEHLWPSI